MPGNPPSLKDPIVDVALESTAPSEIYVGPGHAIAPRSMNVEAFLKSQFSDIFLPANCDTSEEIFKQARTNKSGTLLGVVVGGFLSLATVGIYLLNKIHTVDSGSYGIVSYKGTPHFVKPGFTVLLNPLWNFKGRYSLSKIGATSVAGLHYINIPKGSVGFAREKGQPRILGHGIHVINNPLLSFDHIESLNNPEIIFDAIKIITVKDGELGISYKKGALDILKAGTVNFITDEFHSFDKFVSTRHQVLNFTPMNLLTRDNISMTVKSVATYEITDIPQLIKVIGIKTLHKSLETSASAALSTIINQFSIKEINNANVAQVHSASGLAPSSTTSAIPSDDLIIAAGEQIIAPTEERSARSQICDAMEKELRKATAAWGVRILGFKISAIDFTDERVQQLYEKTTIDLVKIDTRVKAANGEAAVKTRNARSEADSLMIEVQAKKKAIIVEAEAKAQAAVIEAEGRVKAAKLLTDPLAKKGELASLVSQMLGSLKMNTLVVGSGASDSLTGSMLGNFMADK